MRIFLITAVVLSLVACASSRPIQGPNGDTAYFIKCGSARIDACYEEAAKVCPKGYTVEDKQSNRGPNTMLVQCKQ